MKKALVLFMVGAVGLAGSASAAIITYNFPLSGLQEVPPVQTNAAGAASMTIDTDSYMFDLDLVVFGIGLNDLQNVGPNGTPVHFHNAPAGANGSIVVDAGWFASFQQDGAAIRLQIQDELFGGLQGNLNTDPATNVSELLAGNIYLNVHTQSWPGGEIRGQVVPEPAALGLLALGGLFVRRR